jgi:acetyl esterase
MNCSRGTSPAMGNNDWEITSCCVMVNGRRAREARPESQRLVTALTAVSSIGKQNVRDHILEVVGKAWDSVMWNFHQILCERNSGIHCALSVISGLVLSAFLAPSALAGVPADRVRLTHRQSPGHEAQATQSADPQMKAVLEKMAAAGVLHAATVADVRKGYNFYPTLSGKPEAILHVENREIPGPGGTIPIRLYIPREETGLPIFVFFHGGAFVAGGLDSHDTPLRAISNRCGCIVVSVAYRLAPEHRFPAAPDDCYAATKWVAENAATFGGDARRIAVGGDGAGGNLAAVVTRKARDGGGPALVYQVLIYPTVDAIMRGSRYLSKDPTMTPDSRAAILGAYIPYTNKLQDPDISPIDAKTLSNLPPAFLITDEDDPGRDEADAYARRLVEDGVQVKVSSYPNMIHGFFLMAGELDASKRCIEEISEALRSAFESARQTAPAASQEPQP